jgi:hypothetical protein
MNRRSSTQDIGAGRQRTKVTITSTPCEPEGQQSLAIRQHLMESITYQRKLLQCGFATWQKLRMYHNGESWVVDVEATGDVAGGTSVPQAQAGASDEEGE